jgi:hypothetical protein
MPAAMSSACSATRQWARSPPSPYWSVALLDDEYARDIAEVVVVRGEPDGGTAKSVSNATSRPRSATVSTRPLT